MFLPQVMVPPTVLAVYHAFAFACKVNQVRSTGLWQRYGARAHSWLATHQVMQLDAMLLAAVAVLSNAQPCVLHLCARLQTHVEV